MAFDQATRNRLQKFVGDARKLLSDEFTQQLQNTYGLDPVTGGVAALSDLPALTPSEQQTAQLLRDTLEHYLAASHKADPHKDKALVTAALDRIVREQAFTVLNRLAALRMAEARQFIMESVSDGYQSKGFQLYQRIAGSSLGETGQAYQHYLFSVFDELSLDLAVLFDRYSSQGRLFPRETVLLELLDLINHAELEILWVEDETVGWIYQYFNSKEERKKMRDESQAPRNSRELAVRNQFFTPRYVVEFLTDNTLGRIWYEMTQGNTTLVDSCQYLVRRPNEIFLKSGEISPEQDEQESTELSQDKLLQQAAYIRHRPIKDPRDIKMLDPACGSMHFGLYAFDLFEQIYAEAWDIENEKGRDAFWCDEGGSPKEALHDSYPDKEGFIADVPRLIIEHNIHGVDIDPRAAQIAGLSLWLRAQKTWSSDDVKPVDRPQIQRSNIVCAEPMPGEKAMLKEFASQVQPRVLGQLLEDIFDKMQLAGEAGTLLKIEEEIQSAIDEAKSQKDENVLEIQGGLFGGEKWEVREGKRYYNFGDVSEDFWEQAEQLILSQLVSYSESATDSASGQKRLFAADAEKGFAFIDLCRKRFDVVLMNPPFGAMTDMVNEYAREAYPIGYIDLYTAFVDRGLSLGLEQALVGAITSRTCFALSSFKKWREESFLGSTNLVNVLDLGDAVLDNAMVETAAYSISKQASDSTSLFIDVRKSSDRAKNSLDILESQKDIIVVPHLKFRNLPNSMITYDRLNRLGSSSDYKQVDRYGELVGGCKTDNDARFVRAFWEVSPEDIGIGENDHWCFFSKGGEFSLFYASIHLLVDWRKKGGYLGDYLYEKRPRNGYLWGPKSWSFNHMGKPGLFWSRKSTKGISLRALPRNCASSDKTCYLIPSDNNIRMKLLASLNSISFCSQAKLFSTGHGAYEKGTVGLIPLPYKNEESLEDLALKSYHNVRNIYSLFQSDVNFVSGIRFFKDGYVLGLKRIREFNSRNVSEFSENIELIDAIFDEQIDSLDDRRHDFLLGLSSEYKGEYFISELLGYAFQKYGAEDHIEYKDEKCTIDPFDSIDIERLRNRLSNHAKVLVDDEASNFDVVNSIAEVVIRTLKYQFSEFEEEFCREIKDTNLRDYLTRPQGFFEDHLDLFSKSKRYAPIYWPLQTASGSYTIWLSYHGLNDQVLLSVVNDILDPKLRLIDKEIESLRRINSRASSDNKKLSDLEMMDSEIKDMREEFLQLSKHWSPNQNDGVLVVAAPLWKHFQHKGFRKRLKVTWQEMENGSHDWSHMAYNFWPARVLRKCVDDRSLAVTHGVDGDLWQEVEVASSGGKSSKLVWQPRGLTEDQVVKYIQDKVAQG